MPIDMQYYEALGNPPAPECWISLARGEDFFEAMRDALDYCPSPDGDATRCCSPSIFIEACVRKAKVARPANLQALPFISQCISLAPLVDALQAMIDGGLLEPTDDDPDGQEVHKFSSPTELYAACDSVIAALDGTPEVSWDENKFEVTELHVAAHINLAWLDTLTLATLKQLEGTLQVVTSSRTSTGDDGRPQRMTRVLYDAVEPWPPLPYWHCLDDETWKYLES